MSYTTIRTKIIDLLGEIPEIGTLLDHDPDKFTKWPAVAVEAGSHQNSFEDTAGNDRSFSFLIRCYYPISSGRDQSAEAKLCTVVDRIIEALEAHVTEPDAWEIAQPTRAVWGKDERETPVRFCDLTFTVRSRVLR